MNAELCVGFLSLTLGERILWRVDFGQSEKAKRTLHLGMYVRRYTLERMYVVHALCTYHFYQKKWYFIMSTLLHIFIYCWLKQNYTGLSCVPLKCYLFVNSNKYIYHLIHQMWFFLLLLVSPVADEEISCLGPRPLFCARGSGAGFPGEKKLPWFHFPL